MAVPLIDPWSDISLAGQFAIAGGVVLAVAAVAGGFFVSHRIEDTVVRNTANATALYMESFVAPLTQDLATQSFLSDQSRVDIGLLLAETPLGQRVASFKIWRKDGFLLDASNAELVGQTFAPTENLTQAWQGEVRADFNDTGDEEDVAEHALGLPLLEIYAPVREARTGRVIAVAEFYEIATQLQVDLVRARRLAWGTVGAIVALIAGTLFAIVLRGSRTIDRQLAALKDMVARNLALRLRVQGAAARFTAMNDQALRRIGADLHDGPAQLMGFAALRLDSLRREVKGDKAMAVVDEVAQAVKDSILEIRNISRGLSLPDIEQRPLADILQGLADAHMARVGGDVRVDCPADGLPDVPIAVKICCFRFVQEGLNNAWRHAEGKGLEVHLRVKGKVLRLCVMDRGPGFAHLPIDINSEDVTGLGLAGLMDRVESLGGHITAENRADGAGACLCMELDLDGAA
jgi:signal transduction histidine kinase